MDIFEFDKRFDAFGSYFYFYDYKDPENVPEQCIGAYQVVIADPPFLSEECLEKVSKTVKKILAPGGKILLSSGKFCKKNLIVVLSCFLSYSLIYLFLKD